MKQKEDICKAPKIPFKEPKKIPPFLDLNNCSLEQDDFVLNKKNRFKKSFSIVTNNSENDINININNNKISFNENLKFDNILIYEIINNY